MTFSGPGQVTLLPKQIGRLAELFTEGGAVALNQEGSVITASNGVKGVKLNASGDRIDNHNADQETFPLC